MILQNIWSSSLLCSDWHFSNKYIPNYAFASKIIIKSVRLRLAAVSINCSPKVLLEILVWPLNTFVNILTRNYTWIGKMFEEELFVTFW